MTAGIYTYEAHMWKSVDKTPVGKRYVLLQDSFLVVLVPFCVGVARQSPQTQASSVSKLGLFSVSSLGFHRDSRVEPSMASSHKNFFRILKMHFRVA